MPPAGFEPAISANELPQILALNRSATGIGFYSLWFLRNLQVDRCEDRRVRLFSLCIPDTKEVVLEAHIVNTC